VPANGTRSKNWDEFAAPGAPAMDFIFTVCDSAAGEACPVWLGHPRTAHWDRPEPPHSTARRKRGAPLFGKRPSTLKGRIDLMLSLPLPTLEAMATQRKLRDIGER
jgi:arsenate reductase